MFKQFAIPLHAMVLLSLATFSSAGYAASCTTKVGAVLPTSVDWGKPIAAAAQFAVDQANESGGVNGCDVELVLRDTQADPKVGVDAAKALVDLDKVQVLLGAVSSGVSMPILTSVTAPAGTLQMSCCSSSTAFTALAEDGKTKGLWFRTFATTSVQATVGAKVAADKGWKNMAIFYKNDDWGQDIAKLIAADLKALGVEVTDMVAINDGQPSYRAEVTTALKNKPDAIYAALYPTEGTAVLREWISLGGTQKMLFANSMKSDDVRENVGLKFLGEAIGTDTASPRVASADAFKTLYMAKFNKEPNGPGITNSYDAAMIALMAMQAAGKDATGNDIAAAVARVTDPKGTPVQANAKGFAAASKVFADGGNVMYQGATGNVQFDGNGDVSAPAVTWKYVEGGTEEVTFISLNEVNAIVEKLQ